MEYNGVSDVQQEIFRSPMIFQIRKPEYLVYLGVLSKLFYIVAEESIFLGFAASIIRIISLVLVLLLFLVPVFSYVLHSYIMKILATAQPGFNRQHLS